MKKKGLELSLFKSILFIIIIILTMFSILLTVSMTKLVKENIKSQNNQDMNIVRSIDKSLMEIQTFSVLLELEDFNLQLKSSIIDEGQIKPNFYKLSNQMYDYSIVNKNISNIKIYYPKLKYTVGNLGYYSSESYFALENSLDKSNFLQWTVNISNCTKGFYNIENKSDNNLCYITGLKNEKNEYVAYIIIEINIAKLFQSVDIGYKNNEASGFAMVLNDSVVFYEGSVKDELNMDKSLSKINNRLSSTFNNISYKFYHDSMNLLLPLIYFGIISIIVISTLLFVSIAIAGRIGKKAAEPIYSLLDKLNIENQEDEVYDLINHKLDNFMEEKKLSHQKIQNQQFFIDCLFLSKIIKENISDENLLEKIALEYNVSFEYSFFRIAVLKIDCTSNIFRELFFNYFNIKNCNYIIAENDNLFVILLNSEQILPLQACKDIFNNFPIKYLKCSIGLCYDTLDKILSSYLQAKEILPLDCKITGFEDNINENKQDKSYSLREAFYTALENKDYDTSILLKDEYFKDSLFSGLEGDSLKYRHQKLFDIMNLLGECTLNFTNTSLLKDSFLKNIILLKDNKNIENIERELPLAEKAKKIIENEYTNKELNLYYIAMKLGISNSYLSTIFKNSFNIGVIQYINQLRIELAKSLIISSTMNIKDIALTVGFSSDVSFIRVFKQKEDVTPNSLRVPN